MGSRFLEASYGTHERVPGSIYNRRWMLAVAATDECRICFCWPPPILISDLFTKSKRKYISYHFVYLVGIQSLTVMLFCNDQVLPAHDSVLCVELFLIRPAFSILRI